MDDEKTTTPAAPAYLPPELQKKWAKTYAIALEEATTNYPGDTAAQKQAALREANRMLRVPVLKSYEDAAKLPSWQIFSREERDGSLKLVTIDARKYTFDIPAKTTPAAAQTNAKPAGDPPTAA